MERCRCCLGPAGAGSRCLAGRLHHRLLLCTGLHVHPAAGLPDHICRTCIKRLRDAFQFRHQCHESDANLRVQFHISSENDVKREIVFNSVDVSQCDWDSYDNNDDDSDSDLPLNNLKTLKNEKNIDIDSKDRPVKVRKKRYKDNLQLLPRKNKKSKNLTKCTSRTEKVIDVKNENVAILDLNNLHTDIDQISAEFQNQTDLSVKLEHSRLNDVERLDDDAAEENDMEIDLNNDTSQKKKQGRTDMKKLYFCDVCGHSVKIKYDLITHFRRHTGEKPYKCDTCDKQFAHDAGLRAHKRQHTGQKKSFVCDVCGKGLSTKETLQAHRRLHTGELPYTCPTCGRAFRALTNLRSHRKIHTGDKRHPCPVCNKLFYTKSDMRNHARRHTGERPYACTLCPQRFTGKSNHRLHMKIHAGQKDFQCPFCPKSFVSRDSMRRHGRIHTGERTFECQECNRKFAHRSTLMSHQAIHSKTKDHVCDICNQRFGYPSGLYVHRKKKHNIQPSRIIPNT